MRTRQLLWGLPVAGAIAGGFGVDRWLAAAADAKQELTPAVNLPMTRVVLFNSGVGYFARSGEVEGDARVDLAFQETDVNDLLKSLVLEDFGNGRIAAVSYDSREPIGRTLGSFAINLNDNPTFAGILTQARGERVEVTVQPNAASQPGKLVGAIIGIEHRSPQVELLNLWCAEGLRSVKLIEIQQLRFANPVLESEFRRALEVLASNHDSQKKSVSLHFAGDGKRKVQVGYVIEAPIWKTSYRLILDAKDKKPYLQGWAMVENPTDEDWVGVKMALISGRPISFKMDLYNPLFVPRPTVEPDLFASLRPPTYDGGFGRMDRVGRVVIEGNTVTQDRVILNQSGLRPTTVPPPPALITPARNTYGVWDGTPDQPKAEVARLVRQYRDLIKRGDFAAAEKVAILAKQLDPDDPSIGALAEMAKVRRRLQELNDLKNDKEHMFADGLNAAEREGPLVDTLDPIAINRQRNSIHRGAVESAATGAALGDFFQYAIDHPVSLARQKSALLPIVNKEIEGSRVSIFNPRVQAKHPLLGLRFKNTSGLHLAQGPITVFEGNTYAGDTRVLDVQPNEERLVSYAIDLGTEVDPQAGEGTTKISSVKAVKGIVTTTAKIREVRKYRMVNRSPQDRVLILEHPNRTNDRFKLVETEKPIEDTKDVYRFQVTLKAGEEKSFVVTEECDAESSVALMNTSEDRVKYFLSMNEAAPALKQKLGEVLKHKAALDSLQQELGQVLADLSRLNQDQDRIRKNLANTPREADVYQTYLKKLSDQEKEIDLATAKQKKLMADGFAARKSFEDYLANLTD